MAATELRVEVSLQAPGLTARLLTYVAESPDTSDSKMYETVLADYYFSHILTPDICDLSAAGALGGPLFKPGAFQFRPNCLPVQYRPARTRARVAQCIFEPKSFEKATGLGGQWRPEHMQSYLDVRNPHVRDAMASVERELAEPAFDSLLLIEALGQVLTIEISRHFSRPPVAAKPLGLLAPWQIKRIVDYVHANCGDGSTPSTTVLAGLCNISAGHLNRSFKSSTGETPHTFVERVRLDKARDLLRETDMPLKSIAAAAGFGSQSRFSETFRRRTGEQPNQYRGRMRTQTLVAAPSISGRTSA